MISHCFWLLQLVVFNILANIEKKLIEKSFKLENEKENVLIMVEVLHFIEIEGYFFDKIIESAMKYNIKAWIYDINEDWSKQRFIPSFSTTYKQAIVLELNS